MYYIKKISIFLKNIIFNYFTDSDIQQIIEYRDRYLETNYESWYPKFPGYLDPSHA